MTIERETISVVEAARRLGRKPNTLYSAIQNGSFPLGFAYHCKTGGKDNKGRWHYEIPRKPFEKFLECGIVPGKND